RKRKDWYLRTTDVDRTTRYTPVPRHVSVQELLDSTQIGKNTDQVLGSGWRKSSHSKSSASSALSSGTAILNSLVSLADIQPCLELLPSAVPPLSPPAEDGCIEELPAWFQPFRP